MLIWLSIGHQRYQVDQAALQNGRARWIIHRQSFSTMLINRRTNDVLPKPQMIFANVQSTAE